MSETAQAETVRRANAAAILRAIADLLDDESIPVPNGPDLVFWIRRTPDNVAAAEKIIKGLPGGEWTAEQKNWGTQDQDYLEITGRFPGLKVDIEVPMADAGRETGTRTITEYEPVPVIANLLSTDGTP